MTIITQAVVLEAAPEEVGLAEVGLVEGEGTEVGLAEVGLVGLVEAREETATILTLLAMMGHRWKLRHLQQRAQPRIAQCGRRALLHSSKHKLRRQRARRQSCTPSRTHHQLAR